MTTATDNLEDSGGSVKRSEYIAVAALALNVLTLTFGGGVYVNEIKTQGKAIEELKVARATDRRDFEEVKNIVVRIDENVKSLADRAREDREMERHKR